MPIQLTCPGCAAPLTVADEHTGKKVRCKKCRHIFNTPALSQSDDSAPAAPGEAVGSARQAAARRQPEGAAERPGRRKKKQQNAADPTRRRLIIGMAVGGGVLALLLIGVTVTAAVLLSGKTDPRTMVTGKWKGVVNIPEPPPVAMDDPSVNAKSLLGALARKHVQDLEAVKVNFKPDGTAFYAGDLSCLGISKGGDGRWEVVRHEGDVVFVRLSPPEETFEARLAFSGSESFVLTRLDKDDMPPVLFTFQK